jgi:four helix bundle protein
VEKVSEIKGHKWMRVWQNADRLEQLTQKVIKKIPAFNFRLRSQIDRASNSIVANFVEGYYSGSTLEYLRFIKYGKRSLGELQQHFQSCLHRKYISGEEFNELNTLCWQTMYLFDRLIRSLNIKIDRPAYK